VSDKANETEVIPKCARVECQTLRAQLDVAKECAQDILDARNEIDWKDSPEMFVSRAIFMANKILAKLEELEKCDKGET